MPNVEGIGFKQTDGIRKWWKLLKKEALQKMYDFSLLIYFISLGILWSQPLCKGATHWIVTEDGRIQQQVQQHSNNYLLNYSQILPVLVYVV